jgi:hypothetical protein
MHKRDQTAYQALRRIPPQPSDISIQLLPCDVRVPSVIPTNIPRSATTLFRCCSTWGPGSDSVDTFRLSTNSLRSHWILWHGYFDDNEYMRWIYQPVAVCKYRGVQSRAAAFHMLVGLLRSRDCFQQILRGICFASLLEEREVRLARQIAKSHTN